VAKVDYWGVKNELRQILDDALDNVTVVVEADMQMAAEQTPWVGVYLEGRDIPRDQPIAAGRVSRVRVRLSIWVWCHNIESLEASEKERDRLLGEIELILMNNRTLNNKVEALWIEGGELPSTKDPSTPGFFSGGEIKIASDIRAEV
jgi:hypothetical protein